MTITITTGHKVGCWPGAPPQNSIELFRFKCKLSCCHICSFCTRAFAKERSKSRRVRLSYEEKSIKICERCFLCHSITLCQTCHQCQQCCTKASCRSKTPKILANLVNSGCRSEGCSNPERGLHPPLPDQAKTCKISHSRKLLCQSSQEQLPVGGITSAYRQKCSGTGQTQNISRFFQSTISSPKAKQPVETYIRSEQSEFFPQGREIQNGDTGNHQDIPPTRGVGHLNRLQGRLLSHTDTGTIQEIPEIPCPGSDLPIQSLAFRSVHGTLGVHCRSKGGQTDGLKHGYKDPPIPRRLVGESQIPRGLSPAYSGSSKIMSKTRLDSEFGKVRLFQTIPNKSSIL